MAADTKWAFPCHAVQASAAGVIDGTKRCIAGIMQTLGPDFAVDSCNVVPIPATDQDGVPLVLVAMVAHTLPQSLAVPGVDDLKLIKGPRGFQ